MVYIHLQLTITQLYTSLDSREAIIKRQPIAGAWATKHNKKSFSLINFYSQGRGHADTCLV